MNEQQLEEYLARIGARRPARPDAEALRELQEQHLRTVPFENLSIHLGEQITLTTEALFDKVVRRRRGGFCYELNGLFAELLRGLGFDVTLLAAKVAKPDGTLGPPFDHLALRVELDEPWLVDVGFGVFAHRPLRIALSEPQPDPEAAYTVQVTDNGDIHVAPDDGRPGYVAESRPRELAEFAPTCWYQATSPESHFTTFTMCSRLTPDGARITLGGDTLYETANGKRTGKRLRSDAEMLAAYRETFGFELDRLPVILHPRS